MRRRLVRRSRGHRCLRSADACPPGTGIPHLGSAIDRRAGAYAYVASSPFGIVDISDPSAPTIAGSLSVGAGWDVALAGDLAYLAGGSGGFKVLDISDPSAPAQVAARALEGDALGVAVDGDFAYCATTWGLHVIRIADPSQPSVVDRVPLSDAHAVAVEGDFAYVLAEPSGIFVFDVSDPYSVRLVARNGVPDPTTVAVDWPHIFVSARGHGLQIFDVSHPESPPVGRIGTGHRSVRVAVDQDIAVVLQHVMMENLYVIDVSNPLSPVIVGNLFCYGFGVAAVGGFAYVIEYYSGLEIIDVSDPGAPARRGNVRTPGSEDIRGGAQDIVVEHGLAYIADGEAGLQIAYVADPDAPFILGGLDTIGYAYAVALSRQWAYVLSEGGLAVIDVSSPMTPLLLAMFPMWRIPGRPADIDVQGDYAYLPYYPSGLVVVDLSNLSAMHVAGTTPTPGEGARVAVSGTFVYLVDESPELHVIDVSWPAMPRVIGTTGSPASDVCVSGGHVFTSGEWVLDVLPVQCQPPISVGDDMDAGAPPAVRRVSAAPNPARHETTVQIELPESSHVHLRIYDVSGRLVRTLFDGDAPAGQRVVRWDGLDDGRQPVPAGVYLVKVAYRGAVQTTVVTLVR